MSLIVLRIDIVLQSIVWSKMWLRLTRKLWSTILPFDLLIKQSIPTFSISQTQMKTWWWCLVHDNSNWSQLVMIIMDKLIINFLELKEKILLNKIERRVDITWMEKALVLWEYGMEVIGHKDPISYGNWVFLLHSLHCCLVLNFVVNFHFQDLFFLFFQNYVSFFVSISMLTFYLFCRYNNINDHLWDIAFQQIISMELKDGHFL